MGPVWRRPLCALPAHPSPASVSSQALRAAGCVRSAAGCGCALRRLTAQPGLWRAALREAAWVTAAALLSTSAAFVASGRGERLLSVHAEGAFFMGCAVFLVAAMMQLGLHLLARGTQPTRLKQRCMRLTAGASPRCRQFCTPSACVWCCEPPPLLILRRCGARWSTVWMTPLRRCAAATRVMPCGLMSDCASPSASPQHLAYCDLCFVAEKDCQRRDAVFADDTGASWSALVKAAFIPVDAVTSAAAALVSSAGGREGEPPNAARELGCVVTRCHDERCCADTWLLTSPGRSCSWRRGAYARWRHSASRQSRTTALGWRRPRRRPWATFSRACCRCTQARTLFCAVSG